MKRQVQQALTAFNCKDLSYKIALNLEVAVSSGDSTKVKNILLHKSIAEREEILSKVQPSILANLVSKNNIEIVVKSEIVVMLLSAASSKRKQEFIELAGFSVFQLAASLGYEQIVVLLLNEIAAEKKQIMIKSNGYKSFCRACAHGHVKTAELLIKEIAADSKQEMINANECRALIRAAKHGRNEIVVLILREVAKEYKQVMLRFNDFNAFYMAVLHNRLKVASLLLSEVEPKGRQSMIKVDRFNLFCRITKCGLTRMAELLLAAANPILKKMMLQSALAKDEGLILVHQRTLPLLFAHVDPNTLQSPEWLETFGESANNCPTTKAYKALIAQEVNACHTEIIYQNATLNKLCKGATNIFKKLPEALLTQVCVFAATPNFLVKFQDENIETLAPGFVGRLNKDEETKQAEQLH
jgi:hypothetical protein